MGMRVVMSTGMLLLRIVIGALFMGHGLQKLYGWLDGYGLDGTAHYMEGLGYSPGRTHAVLAGAAETTAGVLLALGLFTPLGAAIVVGVMLNAIVSVHLQNGPWIARGGYEYNAVLIAAALAVTFVGPGAASADSLIGWDLAGTAWGFAALLFGAAVGTALLATRRPAVAPLFEDEVVTADRESVSVS